MTDTKSFREWYKEQYGTDFPEAYAAERYDNFMARQMERCADFMDYIAANAKGSEWGWCTIS
jgi:hypothetical protein